MIILFRSVGRSVNILLSSSFFLRVGGGRCGNEVQGEFKWVGTLFLTQEQFCNGIKVMQHTNSM